MIKISKILFPTDFSEAAQNAFRYALWFANKYKADIELLHVVYPDAEPMDFPVLVARATKEKMETAKQMMKVFVETSLAQIQAGHQLEYIPNVQPEIKMGGPANLIAETATTKNADFIIMGTQGEHSAMEKAIGSVTTATLNKAHCPVLVVPEAAKYEKINTVAYAADLRETDPYHIWETGKLLNIFSPILRIVHIVKDPQEKRPFSMEDLERFFTGRDLGLQITFHTFGSDDVIQELDDFANAWEVDLMVMHKPRRLFFEKLFHRSVTTKEAFHTHVPLLVIK